MRVLIVGCGYVGLPLGAELAEQGHKVFGLRRSAVADAELKRARITPWHADISKPETLAALPANFDWVVNCAASGGGGADEYRQLYLNGNRNLVAWLAGSVKKFIYTSSTGVYGQNDGSLVDETSSAHPTMDTAKVLVETEQLLLTAARENNFPAMVMRVAGIYGPGRGYLLKQFLNGDARIEGDGSRMMNMIHREDLIAAIIAGLERGQPGEIYNAADDEPVSQKDFFTWLAGVLKKELPPVIPANAEAGRKRGITNKRVSNRKLKTELNVQFRFPTFREGYAEEIRQLQAGDCCSTYQPESPATASRIWLRRGQRRRHVVGKPPHVRSR